MDEVILIGALADLLFQATKIRYFTNITHIDNIVSIMAHGILCYEKSCEIEHVSVALEGVQKRREQKSVPNGMPLHRYASLYFSPRNPMMYKLKFIMDEDDFQNLVVLVVSRDVLDLENVVITDGNAANNVTRFYSPEEGIALLDYSGIYAKYWADDNKYVEYEKKRKKCAEILVPYLIPREMIIGAIVSNEEIKERLLQKGFSDKVIIDSNTFFL